jgi:hypothetical protein
VVSTMGNEVEIIVTGHNRANSAFDLANDQTKEFETRFKKTFGEIGDTAEKELGKAKYSVEEMLNEVGKADDEAKTFGHTLFGVGTEAEHGLDGAANGLEKLDRRLRQVREETKALKEEFHRTGDFDLLGNLKDLKDEEKKLQGFRKQLVGIGDDGKKAGTGFTSSFVDSLGSIPSSLKGALIVGAIAGAPIAANLIGTALGAAVTLGVGGGVLAAGIYGAAQDGRVKSAWMRVGETAKNALTDASGPFVEPLVEGAHKVDQAIDDIRPHIEAALEVLAPIAGELADGAAGFTRAIGPGLEKLANFLGAVSE